MKHPMLNTAVKAARAAGKLIHRATLNLDTMTVMQKGPNDFVTEIDQEAEKVIFDTLSGAYPDHSFWMEESGLVHSQSGDPLTEPNIWIIDPIDGTKNFMHGFARYAVSIGLMQRGVLQVGVIYAPATNELFVATKGGGAFVDDRRIRVSKRLTVSESLVATGYPYRSRLADEHRRVDSQVIEKMAQQLVNIRRTGSAALDLADVAAGRLDGYFDRGLKAWDVAAGILLVQEAGGYVGSLSGDLFDYDAGDILAATPKVFPQLAALISG